MSDGFTEVTSVGWFQRLTGSIGGVLIGLVLAAVAFPLLFWNEGRAVTTARTLEEGRGLTVDAVADRVDPANEGRLVHVTGEAVPEGVRTDDLFGISTPGVRLKRTVEIYQWKEESETREQDKLGGGKERVTTYTYKKVWADGPINSSGFKQSVDHQNHGTLPFDDKTFSAETVRLGAFTLSESQAGRMTTAEPLPAGAELAETLNKKADRPKDRVWRLQDGVLYYQRTGLLNSNPSPSNPQIDDIRVRFEVVKGGPVSVLAKQMGTTFAPYHTRAGGDIDRLERGTVDKEAMFDHAVAENNVLTWVLRVVGWLLMALGIYLIARPLEVATSVLPFLGDLVGMALTVFAGLVALVLSLATIAVGWVFYRPLIGVALLAVAALLAGLLVWGFSRRSARAAG